MKRILTTLTAMGLATMSYAQFYPATHVTENLRVDSRKCLNVTGRYRFFVGITKPQSVNISGDVYISNYLGYERSSDSFSDVDSIYGRCIGSFSGCSNITSVTISNGNRSPYEYYCSGLQVDITNVVDEAFKGCTSLRSFYASGIPKIGTNVFAGDTNLLSVTWLGAPPKDILASGMLANFPINFVYSPEYSNEWASILLEQAGQLKVEYEPSIGRTISDKEELELKVHCNCPHAKIYYTTDGTDPTSASLECQGAIAVSGLSGKEVAIKAVAIVDGWPTDPATIKGISFPVQKTPDNDCITFTSDGGFSLKTWSKGWDVGMQWSINKIDWEEWNGGEISAGRISSSGNYALYVRGDANTVVTGSIGGQWELESSDNNTIACSGNIETLRGATGDAPAATPMAEHCYECMFGGLGGELMTSAPALPATTLSKYCYHDMFFGCRSMTTAPKLPATSLAEACYWGMFCACTSLTATPELPATILAESCYMSMFYWCNSLMALPELPAKKLKYRCYYGMFGGCTNLVVNSNASGTPWSIPANATTATDWNTYMFGGTAGDFTGDPQVGVTYYIGAKELMPKPPAIKPSSGTTFDTSLTVSMTCASEGATIHYTTDGNVPTMESAAYASKFKIYGKTTVKAIAFYEDGTASEMTVAEFANGRCETPSVMPPNGTTFDRSGLVVTLSHENPEGVLRYTTDGTDPTEKSAEYTGPFAIDETTTIKAKVFGDQYLDSGVVTATLTRVWLKVATPVITAPATFTGSKAKVTIFCETEGATVRYTTDGSEPNSHDEKYTKPFFITDSATVKAKATKTDYTASDTASFVIVRKWGIGDTMGKPDHAFETDGDANFCRVVDETATRGESMRSGDIDDEQDSVLATTVVGSGTLTFKWKTSCEATPEHDWDHAEFAVDGTQRGVLDGVTDWIEVPHRIDGEGEHMVTWTYKKDDIEAQGEDCLWVSDYAWASDYTTTQTTDVPVPYDWLTQKCRDVVDEYESYENVAKQAAYNPKYTVEQCYVAGLDPESATNEFTAAIEMIDGVPNVTWQPDKKSERAYKILGSTNLVGGGDWECPTNSLHRFFKVTVEMP